jgi:flagella basal body P-ring formation protein FlgA
MMNEAIMKQTRHTVCLLVLMLSAVGFAAASAAESTVVVRDRVIVTSPVVRLGDVAEIISADRSEARRLAALPLMPAPSPGSERFLRKREVADLLDAHGQDLRELRIEGAMQVAISKPATTPGDSSTEQSSDGSKRMNLHAAILAAPGRDLGASLPHASLGNDDVRDLLHRAVERHLSASTGKAGPWHVTCQVGPAQLVQLRAATSPVECHGGREPWLGRQRFIVSFTTTQGAVRFPFSADVRGDTATVAVAIRSIAGGAVITAADVELQEVASVPSSTSRRSPIVSLEKLIGMEARSSIQSGQIIWTDQIQAPLLVKRGETITVVSQGGGIRVRTTARARQDGAQGELVQVETLETRERYDARVTGPREAAVFSAVRPSLPEAGDAIKSWAMRPETPRSSEAGSGSIRIESARR